MLYWNCDFVCKSFIILEGNAIRAKSIKFKIPKFILRTFVFTESFQLFSMQKAVRVKTVLLAILLLRTLVFYEKFQLKFGGKVGVKPKSDVDVLVTWK